MRRLVLALSACALLAGCGTNFDAETPSGATPGSGTSGGLVAAQDVARVLTAQQTIDAACAGQNPSPQQLDDAVSVLVDVYQLGPRHVLKYGSEPVAVNMVTELRDQAGRLRRCGQPALAQRLERVIGRPDNGA